MSGRGLAAIRRWLAVLTMFIVLAPPMFSQDTVRVRLPEAISIAAAHNIDLQRAANSLRSNRARIEQARGAYQPNLSLSLGPSFRYQPGAPESATGESNSTSTSLSLGASSSYTLYNGGADRASVAQAEDIARAGDLGIGRTVQTTVFSIVTFYYQIATFRELIGVARENLDAERKQLERVQGFTDAGTRAISDLYAEQATVASAELSLINAQQNLNDANLSLVQLLRLDPLKEYDFVSPDPLSAADVPSGNDPTTLVQQAVTRRADLAAQQARIDAAQQSIKVAEAGSSATISLSGGISSGYSTSNEKDAFGSQLFSQNPSASLGVSLSLPVFDRDRTDVAVEQARIDLRNEYLTMEDIKQQVAIDVRQALNNLVSAQAGIDAAERQVASARQALDVEQARYETGVSTLVELSQARAKFFSSQAQLVQARNTLELRRRGLAFAVGTIEAPVVTPEQ